MTKQHFIAIAAEFKNALDTAKLHSADQFEGAKLSVIAFCEVAERFNPRFDRARFLAACGL